MSEMLIGIGRLVRLDLVGEGGSFAFRRRGLWLAWRGDPRTGTIVGVRPGRTRLPAREVPAAVRELHETFHAFPPRDAVMGDAAGEPARYLGRCRAVTYAVPDTTPSNKSGDVVWMHRMGDFGRAGGGDRSDDERYWPECWLDARGLPLLVRRPGNRFYFDDWLYS